MRSDDLTADRILAAAEREYPLVRAEMVRLARDLWPAWCGDRPLPEDDGAIVRGVLDQVAAEHPKADDLLDWCREETARIEAFCTERDVIGLADEPLVIQWTPVFLRAFGGAMLSSPGPLDKGQKAFFAITPMPDDWSEEQRESYLREDNERMLRLLCIHEAVPGHYLQGVYANRSPSLARSIFASGLFAEGWAVYVTQVMMDLGYGADDPALLLTHWKFYLRSITNTIIDARIHCDGMTGDEAVALMVDGGFQEESEARAKFDRARLSSTQLSTYFSGLDGDVGDRARGARRRLAGRPARSQDRRAAGRPWRDAGLRLPRPPRVGHRPRDAARRRCSGGSCSADFDESRPDRYWRPFLSASQAHHLVDGSTSRGRDEFPDQPVHSCVAFHRDRSADESLHEGLIRILSATCREDASDRQDALSHPYGQDPIDLFDTRTRRPDQQMLPRVARVPALAEQASASLDELAAEQRHREFDQTMHGEVRLIAGGFWRLAGRRGRAGRHRKRGRRQTDQQAVDQRGRRGTFRLAARPASLAVGVASAVRSASTR